MYRSWQEKETSGFFAWLQKHAPLLSPVHAAYVVAGAVFLQCAVIAMRTLAGVNKQQLAAQEVKEAAVQEAARIEAAKQPYVPPPPPLGPAFSSDEGKPLLGFSGGAIEAELRLRQQARRMRQEEVMANNGFSELKQPKVRTKGSEKATRDSTKEPKNVTSTSAAGALSATVDAPYKPIHGHLGDSEAAEKPSEPIAAPSEISRANKASTLASALSVTKEVSGSSGKSYAGAASPKAGEPTKAISDAAARPAGGSKPTGLANRGNFEEAEKNQNNNESRR
jgi:hypothetical protein